MNKNSNVYIIIYASVMIIIVAVLLSVASMALKAGSRPTLPLRNRGLSSLPSVWAVMPTK